MLAKHRTFSVLSLLLQRNTSTWSFRVNNAPVPNFTCLPIVRWNSPRIQCGVVRSFGSHLVLQCWDGWGRGPVPTRFPGAVMQFFRRIRSVNKMKMMTTSYNKENHNRRPAPPSALSLSRVLNSETVSWPAVEALFYSPKCLK